VLADNLPDIHTAYIPATVFDLCDKQLLSHAISSIKIPLEIWGGGDKKETEFTCQELTKKKWIKS
jgi:hypothetical protein